jgi:hypothetical protein
MAADEALTHPRDEYHRRPDVVTAEDRPEGIVNALQEQPCARDRRSAGETCHVSADPVSGARALRRWVQLIQTDEARQAQ